jgi:hypothetical protein
VTKDTRFFQPGWLFILLVVSGLALGLGIRAYDLTDPPFDFHATRQFRSAIIARGMYYESLDDIPDDIRESAMYAWGIESVIEPQVLEKLAVWSYLISGAEHLWIPRLLSAIFWVLAGLAVLLIGRELGSLDAGLVAMFYFLFLPYSIYASRTFQPDPLMVGLIAWALWALLRWYRIRTLKMALWAGLLAGLSIYVKSVALYFVGFGFAGLILLGVGLRNAIRDKQIWAMGILTILPNSLFYIYGLWIAGFLGRQFNYRFFPDMLRDPAFYIRWQEMTTNIAGFGAVLAGLAGILLLEDKGKRGLLVGMWFGYGLYSLTFPYHTLTHDYYQLPFLLLVAISLISVLSEIFQRLSVLDRSVLARSFVVILLFGGAFFKTWDVRVNLARDDYRSEYEYWADLGELIEPGKRTLSLSHAYGYYLSYYGHVANDYWPGAGDFDLRALAGDDVDAMQKNLYTKIDEYDYFVITKMGDFNANSELKAHLYDSYHLQDEGDGYLIFDLNQPAIP